MEPDRGAIATTTSSTSGSFSRAWRSGLRYRNSRTSISSTRGKARYGSDAMKFGFATRPAIVPEESVWRSGMREKRRRRSSWATRSLPGRLAGPICPAAT